MFRTPVFIASPTFKARVSPKCLFPCQGDPHPNHKWTRNGPGMDLVLDLSLTIVTSHMNSDITKHDTRLILLLLHILFIN